MTKAVKEHITNFADLAEDERLDSLPRDGLFIIQSAKHFAYCTDSLLLADFVRLRNRAGQRLLDLCSGNGVIPLCLAKRYPAEILGVEVQEKAVSMAQRSFAINDLSERLVMHQMNLKDAPQAFGHDQFDAITCNPPYFTLADHPIAHHDLGQARARHEIDMTLSDIFLVSRILLKTRGKLFMVHRPERLQELMRLSAAYHFGLERLRFVYPKLDANSNMVLLEWIKGGGQKGSKILPPLVIYEGNQTWTAEARQIFHG